MAGAGGHKCPESATVSFLHSEVNSAAVQGKFAEKAYLCGALPDTFTARNGCQSWVTTANFSVSNINMYTSQLGDRVGRTGVWISGEHHTFRPESSSQNICRARFQCRLPGPGESRWTVAFKGPSPLRLQGLVGLGPNHGRGFQVVSRSLPRCQNPTMAACMMELLEQKEVAGMLRPTHTL